MNRNILELDCFAVLRKCDIHSLYRYILSQSVFMLFKLIPYILNLMQIGVHLWATGEEILSSHAFLLLKDVSSMFSSDFFDICLIKMFKAFIGHCKFVEPALIKHMQFLRNSFVELCSQDLQKSSSKAMISIQKMSRILQLGLQTKKKVCRCILHALHIHSEIIHLLIRLRVNKN